MTVNAAQEESGFQKTPETRLMTESVLLLVIGLADLAATIALISFFGAREANPLMAFYLQFGVGAFVLAKLTLLFFPIFIAEWSKAQKPVFVKWMMRSAIAAYVVIYVALFIGVNVVGYTPSSCDANSTRVVSSAQR